MFNRKASLNLIQPDVATPFQQAQSLPLSFAQLYDTYFTRVYNYVSYRVANREEAEDLTSVTFEKALQGFTKFDERKGSIESWLFTIAHNVLVNYYRSRQRRPQTQLDENLESDDRQQPGERFLRAEELQQLSRYLAKLSDRDRELIALRFGANLSHKQIADTLKMREGSVTTAISRAVSRLRRLFEAEENG